MAISLKNLLARPPRLSDLASVHTLMLACDLAEDGLLSGHNSPSISEEDLLAQWRRPGFSLEQDAVIVLTTQGQLVGYTDVWHYAFDLVVMRVQVHPDYRHRGIGTLLLRLAEERARDYARKTDTVVCFTLQSAVSAHNPVARDLLEREGFQLTRRFSRLIIDAEDPVDSGNNARAYPLLVLDVQSALQMPRSPQRTGIFTARQYDLYEKDMRVGESLRPCNEMAVV